MLFAVTFFRVFYLRETTPSRPASRFSFRQPVDTVTAPCAYLYYIHIFLKLTRFVTKYCLGNSDRLKLGKSIDYDPKHNYYVPH